MSLIIEKKGSILQITLNRPEKANSLDPPTLVNLRKVILDAQTDNDINVIVLTGIGEKNFTTGIDIVSAMNLSPESIVNLAKVAGDIATLLYYGKPSIVGINGRAMGMGVVYPVAADYRLIVENVLLQMPEVNIPVFPAASCTALMTRVCGITWTRRILLTGYPIDSNNAVKARIADEIVATQDMLITRMEEVSRELASKHPAILKAIKFSVLNAHDMDYMSTIELESRLLKFSEWTDDVEDQYSEFTSKYGIEFELTGNPEMLMQDYKRNN
ncbi:MAG: enoyl-CoA hydratase/isomerase family protein [Candidatus Hodarchaeales archaeon]